MQRLARRGLATAAGAGRGTAAGSVRKARNRPLRVSQENGESGVLARVFEALPGSDRIAAVPEVTASARQRAGGPAAAAVAGMRRAAHVAVEHLLPIDHESSVGPTYLDYVKWTMAASVVGTVSGVLSMQSLLYSVGLSEGSIPAAAALNWILKDGLGQLGGVLFASAVNQRFDAEPKRWRFKSAAVLDASILLEVMTPWFPGHFLLIASVANVGKNVGWLSASATRAGIHRSFMRVENMADITGKAGSQSIAASVLGTGIGIGVSSLVSGSTATIFAATLGLSVVHLACTHKAMDTVVIRTLNLQRLWLALRPAFHYDLAAGQARLDPGLTLDPERVAREERYLHLGSLSARRHGDSVLEQDEDTTALAGRGGVVPTVRLRIGAPLEQVFAHGEALAAALDVAAARGDHHLLQVVTEGAGRPGPAKHTVHVLFLVEAGPEHLLRAMLHAFTAHQLLLLGLCPPGEAAARARAALASTSVSPAAARSALQDRGWDADHLFFEPARARVALAEPWESCGSAGGVTST